MQCHSLQDIECQSKNAEGPALLPLSTSAALVGVRLLSREVHARRPRGLPELKMPGGRPCRGSYANVWVPPMLGPVYEETVCPKGLGRESLKATQSMKVVQRTWEEVSSNLLDGAALVITHKASHIDQKDQAVSK